MSCEFCHPYYRSTDTGRDLALENNKKAKRVEFGHERPNLHSNLYIVRERSVNYITHGADLLDLQPYII